MSNCKQKYETDSVSLNVELWCSFNKIVPNSLYKTGFKNKNHKKFCL